MEKFTINKPIYENCQIVAPDGEPLCKCDRKKIDWYLSKDLADIIQEDPIIIKIKFEPNGRGISAYKGDLSADNQYYVDYKKNQCVVCGSENNLLRFQIVPAKYRSFFPEKFKAHRSHDVLLLCFDCNEIAHKKQHELKTELCQKYNVPSKLMDNEFLTEEKLDLIQRNCKTLIKGKNKIPEERTVELLSLIINDCKEVIEFNILTEDQSDKLNQLINAGSSMTDFSILQNIIKIKFTKSGEFSNKKRNLHGKVLIEKLGGDDSIPEFIKLWRKHFLETMNPKYLPNNWSINHSIERSFGTLSRFYTKQDENS